MPTEQELQTEISNLKAKVSFLSSEVSQLRSSPVAGMTQQEVWDKVGYPSDYIMLGPNGDYTSKHGKKITTCKDGKITTKNDGE